MAKVKNIFVVKYRIYPTDEQKEFICNQFGACKYVYNRAFHMREDVYKKKKELQKKYGIVDVEIVQEKDKNGQLVFYKDGSPKTYEVLTVKNDQYCKNKNKEIEQQLKGLYKEITLKNIREQVICKDGENWLKNGNFDSTALNYELRHLDNAYKRFFQSIKNGSNVGKPHAKSKRCFKNSYTTARGHQYFKTSDGTPNFDNNIGNLHIDGNYLKLPKLDTKVRIIVHRLPPENCILKSVTISKYSSIIDEYYASCQFEYETNENTNKCDTRHIGLDYSQKSLYVDSFNQDASMERYYKNNQEKLSKLRQNLELYTKGSCRYRKLQKRIAKVEQHIKNQRQYFLHNKSKELADNYDVISIEDLSMKEQSSKDNKVVNIIHTDKYGDVEKYKRFGKETLENGWYEFTRQLTYKQSRRNHMLIKVDKYYPSSQLCSNCGRLNEEMKDLSLRTFTCKHCGFVIGRDYNAAKNIDKEGFRLYLETVS